MSAQTAAPARPEAPPVKTYTLPPEQLQKAIDYARARNWVHFIGVAYGIAVLLLMLAAKVAPRMRTWAEGVSRVRFLQAYLFAPLLLLGTDVAGLPLDLYQHHLSLEYRQSVQGWESWFWDWTKGELLSFLLAGVLVWLLYAAIRRSPRRWWFYFWLILTPIEIFLIFIEPVVIEPMFFQFQPLAAGQPALVAEIGKVVARGGLTIPPERMYEMKASEKLNSLNAYVAGIGASKRVVVWDTTIRKMTTGEILFVFGHEMGHYVLGHIRIRLAMVCGVNLLFLFLGYHSARWLLARWGGRWSIRGMDDWASLPVMLLALAVFSFASEPVDELLQPGAGAQRGRVRTGSDPRDRAGFPAGRGGGFPDSGRGCAVGPESEWVYQVLAVRSSAGRRSRALRRGVRSVERRTSAEVCEVRGTIPSRTWAAAGGRMLSNFDQTTGDNCLTIREEAV